MALNGFVLQERYALVAARPEGALPGTEGVAIFFMPIILDGKINNLKIKKLKDKSGTRLLPTAEIDLNGAVAYNIGPIENGFKNLMNYVINTSRLMNSAASLGIAARAYLEARNHASQRMAFGYTIDNYPMIQDSLNGMYSTLAAHRALYFDLVRRLDTNPIDDFKSDEALWQRFLINLCKYRTSIAATNCANEARGIIGANSVDKSFPNYNIVTRLLEDAPILEIWEGAHNVLAEQVARDSHRFHDKTFKQYLDEAMGKYVTNLHENGFVITSQWLAQNWGYTEAEISGLADKEWSEIFARKLLDRLGCLLETAVYATVVGNPNSPQARYVAHYRNNVIMPSLQQPDLSP